MINLMPTIMLELSIDLTKFVITLITLMINLIKSMINLINSMIDLIKSMLNLITFMIDHIKSIDYTRAAIFITNIIRMMIGRGKNLLRKIRTFLSKNSRWCLRSFISLISCSISRSLETNRHQMRITRQQKRTAVHAPFRA